MSRHLLIFFAVMPLVLLTVPAANAQFTTVINVPPDVAPSEIDSDTQVNLFDGGSLPTDINVGLPVGTSSNAEVNVFGGSVSGPNVYRGGTLNIHGGDSFGADVFDGGVLNLFDGEVSSIRTNSGSLVNIEGGSARRVTAVSGSTVNVSGGAVGGDQRLLAELGSTVNVSGGRFINRTEIRGAEVTVTQGDFSGLLIRTGTLDISGGIFRTWASGASLVIDVSDDSSRAFEVNLSGGIIEDGLYFDDALSGGSGPAEGNFLHIVGSEFRIDGNLVEGLENIGETRGDFAGGDFLSGDTLTGILKDGTPFALGDGIDRVFFSRTTLEKAEIPPAAAQVINVPADPAPSFVREGQLLTLEEGGSLGNNFSAAWRSRLTVNGGQVGDNLEVAGGRFVLNSGSIGGFADLYPGAIAFIHGGEIGRGFEALAGSEITVTDGVFGDDAHLAGDALIQGGSFGDGAFFAGNTLIQGGSFGDDTGIRQIDGISIIEGGDFGDVRFLVAPSSDGAIEIRGGTFNGSFDARFGGIKILGGVLSSTTILGLPTPNPFTPNELVGSEFFLDGVQPEGLVSPGDSIVLDNATLLAFETLSGKFLDGNAFAFSTQDVFGASSVRLTLAVPEPSTFVLLGGLLLAAVLRPTRRNCKAASSSGPHSRVVLGPSKLLVIGFMLAIQPTSKSFAQFTTVIDVPPGPIPTLSSDPSKSGIDTPDTQLNLRDGGFLPGLFRTGDGVIGNSVDNIQINVFGGLAEWLILQDGTEFNMMGGQVDELSSGGSTNISGGFIEVFSRAHELTMSGGSVSNNFTILGDAEISGGTIGDSATVIGGDFAMTGGSIGDNMRAELVQSISVSDGSIGESFFAFGMNSEPAAIGFSGGTIGNRYESFDANVVVEGGAFGDEFRPLSFSPGNTVLQIKGGDFRIDGLPLAGLQNVGDSSTVDTAGGLLTGTLSDGTPFAFSTREGDRTYDLAGAEFIAELQVTSLPDAVPFRRVSELSARLLGVRDGEELLVDAPLGDHFNAGWGSVVDVVDGGSVGENFEAAGATLNISGGNVGLGLDIFQGSTANISGGVFGANLESWPGSTTAISGGTFMGGTLLGDVTIAGGVFHELTRTTGNVSGGEFDRLITDATLIVSGGTIESLELLRTGTLTVVGGDIQNVNFFLVDDLGVVEFVGTQFQFDGANIPGLSSPGDTVLITSADVANVGSLNGVLLDGSPLDISLSQVRLLNNGGFRLSIAVPEPTSLLLLMIVVGVSLVAKSRQPHLQAA